MTCHLASRRQTKSVSESQRRQRPLAPPCSCNRCLLSLKTCGRGNVSDAACMQIQGERHEEARGKCHHALQLGTPPMPTRSSQKIAKLRGRWRRGSLSSQSLSLCVAFIDVTLVRVEVQVGTRPTCCGVSNHKGRFRSEFPGRCSLGTVPCDRHKTATCSICCKTTTSRAVETGEWCIWQ